MKSQRCRNHLSTFLHSIRVSSAQISRAKDTQLGRMAINKRWSPAGSNYIHVERVSDYTQKMYTGTHGCETVTGGNITGTWSLSLFNFSSGFAIATANTSSHKTISTSSNHFCREQQRRVHPCRSTLASTTYSWCHCHWWCYSVLLTHNSCTL